MNFIVDAFAFIFDPAPTGRAPRHRPRVCSQHLVVHRPERLIAAVIAVPLGLAIGHTGRGAGRGRPITGARGRCRPSACCRSSSCSARVGLGSRADLLIVLVILAIPPLLAGAYAGRRVGRPRSTIDAARAVGMTEWQILGKVEIPLALPL